MSDAVLNERKKRVLFNYNEREIARRLYDGFSPKELAGCFCVSDDTIRSRIAVMCRKAEVADRFELVIWIQQHPGCLHEGVACSSGLHKQQCFCGSAYCAGRIAAFTPPVGPPTPFSVDA